MGSRDNGLPPKENTLFKSIVKFYETKQYKKGLKAADTVLKKFPEHGETLAMKGLILNCMERKAEAYELVRKGVKLDIKSHVCWHVYGLLYRSDREYTQAIKCYRGALRHDKDNIQILRDLSMLQVQMRDLKGFVETRQQVLTLKPTNRNNWFSFAVAQHLRGRHVAAKNIVESYEKTLEGTPENEYEHGEMLLYKNLLLEESGDLPRALEHLEECESQLVDKLFYKHKRAELLLQLERYSEAEEVYRALLKRNSEHFGYHAGLQAAVLRTSKVVERWHTEAVSADAEAKLLALYAGLQAELPKSTTCKRLPLDFAQQADAFGSALAAYVLPFVRKGVPSIFNNLKPLCSCAPKRAQMRTIFDGWLTALEATGCLPDSKEREIPTTVMWVRALVAQLADLCGDTKSALDHLDKAIEHTPTLLDLYVIKGKVYKHAGDLQRAAEWMEKARNMDLADRCACRRRRRPAPRAAAPALAAAPPPPPLTPSQPSHRRSYLNTKSTRYLIRADKLDEAAKVIALFTKPGDQNLHEMQCMWYEIECANSHARRGDHGRALKNFAYIEKHFTDIVEDQFDFHT